MISGGWRTLPSCLQRYCNWAVGVQISSKYVVLQADFQLRVARMALHRRYEERAWPLQGLSPCVHISCSEWPLVKSTPRAPSSEEGTSGLMSVGELAAGLDMRGSLQWSAKRLCTAARSITSPTVALQQATSSKPLRPGTNLVQAQAVLAAPVTPQQQLTRQPSLSRSKAAELASPPVAYEVIQGPLVRWSEIQPGKAPPTAVLVHGVLGSRKNMQSFARQIVQEFPSWQIILVDLRCHGESAAISVGKAPHTIGSAAADIMALLSRLRLFPQALIGHSLGGKVVMTMAEQFSARATSLPRPVQVWVLDATPGDVRAGGGIRQDHPADLISALLGVALPLPSRSTLQALLGQQGFSPPIAKWASTNLRAIDGDHRKLTWSCDLPGIWDLYQSYEVCDMWRFLSQPAQGITVNFVRAERSVFKWVQPVVDRIVSLGHQVHTLHGAGHWVHTDNPDGLLQILAPSLGSAKL